MELTTRISNERTQLGLSLGYMCGWIFRYKGKQYGSFGQYKEKQTEKSLRKEATEFFNKLETNGK